MKKYNISTNLIRVIKNLYDKATSAVLFNSSIGDWFRATVGVRQGCLLSPTLFNIFLERIMTDALEDHDRQWLHSGLTVHRQIFSTLKHKITWLVDRAKTTFYSSKITVSTTCKELFSVTNRLLNKTKCTQRPSLVPIAQLPQRFSDFFCQKISTIRQNIDSCSSTAPSGFGDQLFFWKAVHPFQRCK